MTQGTSLLRHAVLGRVNRDSAGIAVTAPDTTLALTHCSAQGFEVYTTGEVAAGELCQVAYAGQPRFTSPALAQEADQRGFAATFAGQWSSQGEIAFSGLAGAFTVVLYDEASGDLLAAVDRLGHHSLYYRTTDDGVIFGSLAGDVQSLAGATNELLPQGIYNYIYFHMVPCPGTVYRNLHKLSAAHLLRAGNGQCETRCYWCPTFSESPGNRSMDAAGAELLDTLRQSLRNTLPASGKVGAFLSGGLDSSTVVGVMAELQRSDAEAYSIGFSAEGYDEMAFARITADHFGVKLNEYYVTPEDVVDALPLVATSYDEPFGNSSALPAYFCARMARQNGVDTLLAGDGGDEIFAGNERYSWQRVFEHYKKLPGPLRRGVLEPVLRRLPDAIPLASKARSYVQQANTPLPERLQSYNFLHRHPAAEIFPAELLAECDQKAPLALQRGIYQRPENATDLNRMLYLDWQNTLADNDLRKVSHMCSLAGVDVVYPMLDDALVAFSCDIPSNWKLKGADLRHFYKAALRDWLPEATINKSKQGFGLPFGVWMRTYTPLREMAYDNLLKLKGRGFIRPDFIDRAIEMHQSEHAAYYGELVWILTVFELWLGGRDRQMPDQ